MPSGHAHQRVEIQPVGFGIMQPRLDLAAHENNQLLPKTEDLGDQSCSELEASGESVGKEPNHRKVPYVILINRMCSIA